MKRLLCLLACLVVSWTVVAQNSVPAELPAAPLVEIRGFSQQDYVDMIALCQREERRGNAEPMQLLRLLAIGDLDDLEAIAALATAEIQRNAKALEAARLFGTISGQVARLTEASTSAALGQDLRRVQKARADLIKTGARAFRGDAAAFAKLSAVAKKLSANRWMSSINNLFTTRSDFLTNEALDPARDDLELGAARLVASAMSMREAQFRVRFVHAQIAGARPDAPPAPAAPTPASTQERFENDMLALVDLALKKNAAGDSRLMHLMDMIFLPNVDELPAIMKFAADRVRDDPNDKASILKIAQVAQTLVDAVSADPASSAPLLDVQKRRFELAAKGAQAAKGDSEALQELNALSTAAYSQSVGRRAFELFYLYRNKGDFEAKAAQRSTNAGRASAALMTGIFTLADAQQSVARYQGDVANVLVPIITAGLVCDRKAREEEADWQSHNCEQVYYGNDAYGRPQYRLDCGGKEFTPTACFKK